MLLMTVEVAMVVVVVAKVLVEVVIALVPGRELTDRSSTMSPVRMVTLVEKASVPELASRPSISVSKAVASCSVF